MTRRHRGRLLTAIAVGSLLVLVWTNTTPTLSDWTRAITVNGSNSAAVGSVAFSHTAGSGCSLGPRVSSTAQCSGTVVGSETITNNGTLPGTALSAKVTAASCAPVKLDNAASGASARVLLARNNVGFRVGDPWGGTNAIGLDGSSYASAVTSQTESVPGTNGTHGFGVWFRATGTQAGPLLSFGTNPTATGGTDSRSFVLNANGTVSLYFANSTPVYTSAAAYNDGQWHFAYVRMTKTVLGTITFLTSVDSTASTNASLVTYAGATGYWRLGWAPTSLTGQSTAFFTGQLSNAVVFWGTSAPTTPTATNLSSQASFTSYASTATEQWLLGDDGIATFTGSLPSIGATSPCTYVDATWQFTGPTASAVSGVRLSTFAGNTAYPVSAVPDPGVSQTSRLSFARDATYNTYVTGLRLYVPFSYTVSTSGGQWPLVFTWASNASVVVAP